MNIMAAPVPPQKKVFVYNCPVLTSFGTFTKRPLTVVEAKEILNDESNMVISSLGHASIAQIFSEVTDFPVEVNRNNDQMKAGECAVVMRLGKRAPEGSILTMKEIEEEYGFELELLEKTSDEISVPGGLFPEPVVFIYNCNIVTSCGKFVNTPISVETAQEILGDGKRKIVSSLGHESIARIFSDLTGFSVPVNRNNDKMATGESAIVIRLKKRAPEGVILTRKEIEEVYGYELGLITRCA